MNIENLLKEKLVNALNSLGLEVSVADIVIETSKSPIHGDYATNCALKFASRLKKSPRDFAQEIVGILEKSGIEKIEIAGPGFINFFLEKTTIGSVVKKVIAEGDNYGRAEKKNKTINVEFVSANPTGDLHLGHARIAAVGDSICRLYDFAGFDVTREYYVNNAGNQINTLGLSLSIRYHQAFGEDVELPEDSYHAQDIVDIAASLKAKYGDKLLSETKENFDFITNYGMEEELNKIWRDLDLYRVHFDVVTLETDIRKNDHVKHVLEEKYKKYSYVDDGAIFLKTSDFLDDKDRCVVKKDGSYTYMMPDIAYHLNKLNRGYDLLIDVLGADHHGYINRMKSALMMQGYSSDVLEIELIQIVRLIQGGKEVRMSKRTGAGISLRELCEEVGVDATRYFFVSRAGSAHLDFDLDVALQKNSSNPVYYAQYAHARLCKVLSLAKEKGINIDENAASLSDSKYENDLLKCINDFPKTVESAAIKRAPYMMANFIQSLASAIHAFYTECRLIDESNLSLTSSRLALAKAGSITMKNALNLIGVSAPENM
ncbi:MAG: arginine--tRNA ligase [Erysipelotrichaceae bacterium]|nr:arginine--tRNA ligase [Erysipelotrichaceae bacterium]